MSEETTFDRTKKWDGKTLAKGQHYNCVFTEFKVEHAYKWMNGIEGARFILWGLETCPTTGKMHLQGYIEWDDKKTMKGMLKAMDTWCFIEPRYGTQEQAIAYCSKTGNTYSWGEKKRQGTRTDLADVREYALEYGMRGVLLESFEDEEGNTKPRFGYQACKHGEMFLKYCETGKTEKPYVKVIWGNSGTGKSTAAHKEFPEAYVKSDDTKWFDGYDGHEAIILDDFRDTWMPHQTLLNFLDWVPTRLEIKGSTRPHRAKNIVITCIKHPKEWYEFLEGEPREQLLTRIDKIVEFRRKDGTFRKKPVEEVVEID